MRTTKEKDSSLFVKESVRELTAPEALRTNFMPYAMSVIVSRAIPEIDGLKPSHRKLLYTMYEMGLLNGARTKSANIAARTMLLNPHGDVGNYETMVRLTQNNETLLTPIVDGKGNFSKHYSRDMAYAASRYTEAKLLPVANEFFGSIKKDTVEFVDNYDSTRKEPTLLPVTFPNILANPTEGIAVGMASSIPSFNLNELCEAVILRIRHPETDIREVMPGPDFTTGGQLLLEERAMEKIYETGKGSVRLRARYRVNTKERIIEVYEIPYSTTAEAIIEGIISLIKSGKIKEISDVRNEISLKGFKIAIDYKRGTDPDMLMARLFRMTKLEDSFSCNMTVLINGKPCELGVIEILDEWIRWRRECVKKELSYDLKKKRHALHILEGLATVVTDIDKAVRIIRKTEADTEVIPALMTGFDIDEEQAEFIAEIKLRNLNREYILNKTVSIQTLKEEIGLLEKQLSSDSEINKLIISTLRNVKKKYGQPRRTEILPVFLDETPKEPEIEEYPVKIYRTKEGYIKKIPASLLKSNPEIKVKDEDEIIQELDAMNSSELLFFTDACCVYKVFAHTLKDSRPSALGDLIGNIIESEETVLFVCILDNTKHLMIGFENGKAARIPLSAYETKTNRKKLINAYSSLSRTIGFVIPEENELLGMAGNGRLLAFTAESVPLKTTKTTQGVQVLKIGRGQAETFMPLKAYGITETKGFGCRNLPAKGGAWNPAVR